jgi:hypothetical protein
MDIHTIKWTIDSMHICKELRRELEFWFYGPHGTDPDKIKSTAKKGLTNMPHHVIMVSNRCKEG